MAEQKLSSQRTEVNKNSMIYTSSLCPLKKGGGGGGGGREKKKRGENKERVWGQNRTGPKAIFHGLINAL